MASIYARQGYIREAIDIYRHLLKQQPDCREIIEAIAELEAGCQIPGSGPLSKVIPLVSEWIDLLLRYAAIQKLKGLRQIGREMDTHNLR